MVESIVIEPSVSTTALQRDLGHGTVHILDVRTPGEFESGHISGALNVPLDRLREYAQRLAAVDSELVTVCQTGGRAETARLASPRRARRRSASSRAG